MTEPPVARQIRPAMGDWYQVVRAPQLAELDGQSAQLAHAAIPREQPRAILFREAAGSSSPNVRHRLWQCSPNQTQSKAVLLKSCALLQRWDFAAAVVAPRDHAARDDAVAALELHADIVRGVAMADDARARGIHTAP